MLSPPSCRAPARPDLQNADWSAYLGDPGRRHYSGLVQINRDNVHALEMAWVYDSGELVRGSRPVMYTSPLIVDGVLYGLSPRLVAFALDAATGNELWRHDPDAGGPAQRGLMWWQDDDRARLFYATPAVYGVDGRQYVVIAAGGGRRGPPSGSEYVAFSLPQSE